MRFPLKRVPIFNPWWPNAAIWHYKIWLPLVEVMACSFSIQRQAITWTNADLLSIGPIETNWNEILIESQTSLAKMYLKMSAKCWLNILFRSHWGRVMHICVGKLTIIGSDNGLSPGRRQTIIWTNAGILLFGPLGSNFSEILIEIDTFSFKKMLLKLSSGKWRPFCLGLNVNVLNWWLAWRRCSVLFSFYSSESLPSYVWLIMFTMRLT